MLQEKSINLCSLIIISSLVKRGSVAILCITNLFAQRALQRILSRQYLFAFQTENIYSLEELNFSTRSDSVDLFMAQLKSEKADLTKETGFSYQNLISIEKLKIDNSSFA